jgi:hypothetical protein
VAGRLHRRGHILSNDPQWQRQRRQARLSTDVRLIAPDYPELRLEVDRSTLNPILQGSIPIGSKSGIIERIQTHIVFPWGYPTVEPEAYETGNRFVHNADGHFYSNSRCCLWMGCESEWNEQEADGLLTYLDQLAIFFDRQLVFEATGRKIWPGPARGHGWRGYVELLQESLSVDPCTLLRFLPAFEDYSRFDKYAACPCGSGKSFKWCHARAVQTIANEIGPAVLQRQLMHRRLQSRGEQKE